MSDTRDHDSQDAPVPNASTPVWDLVIADLDEFCCESQRALLAVDMRARDAFGRTKYGTPLQPHNGRDAMKDLYEELLDAVVYAKQAHAEGDEAVWPLYVDIVATLIEVRDRIESRRRKD